MRLNFILFISWCEMHNCNFLALFKAIVTSCVLFVTEGDGGESVIETNPMYYYIDNRQVQNTVRWISL